MEDRRKEPHDCRDGHQVICKGKMKDGGKIVDR